MKALYVKTLLILLLVASSCGPGFYMASSYVDDAYYNPADQPVVVEKRVVVEKPVQVKPEQKQEAVTEQESAEELQLGDEREYVLVDSLTEQMVDEDGNVIVNNHYYYEPDNELEYSNRIYRFNRPGMSLGYYDMWYYDDWYWDSYWYSPYYSGLSFYYSPWRYSYYSPWAYNSWYYSPYYYNSWYSPWNYYSYYSYYGYDYGYGYGKGWSASKYRDNHHYGHRNTRVTDGIGMLPGSASKVQMAEARSATSPRNQSSANSKSLTATGQSTVQNRTSRTQAENKIANSERGSGTRAATSRYTRDINSRSYARPPVRTSRDISTARNSRSTYVRPKTTTGTRSNSSSNAVRGSSYNPRSSSGVRSTSNTYRSSSSAYRSSSSTYRSSGRSSGSLSRGSSSLSRSSGSIGRSSGSSSVSRSSGSSVSRSSGSVSRSSGSSSRSSSSSSRGGGGRR